MLKFYLLASELPTDNNMQQIHSYAVFSLLLGHQKKKKKGNCCTVYANLKMLTTMNVRRTPRRYIFHHLCFFHLSLSVECGGLFILAASSLFLPALTSVPPLPSVPLRFSTWGHGTSEQSSAAKRPTSWSSRRWTACGSTWRRLTTTPFWRQDTCVCEIHTDSLT